MSPSFEYQGSGSRILFGEGSLSQLQEAASSLGCSSLLVVSTPQQAEMAEASTRNLGSRIAGVFSGATMHTPAPVTADALDQLKKVGADGLVSIGGGSTIGLGKALKLHSGLPHIAIPTTYAGSEVTPILGQTDGGTKTTRRDRSLLPEIVIYDPDLTISLPVSLSVTSGLNAIAHAAEALYAKDRNPISSLMAAEGMRALYRALPVIAGAPQDSVARAEALYGAWLCGTVLGTVGMALHHKICHVLGGTFSLPHAETHAVMLPHTIGYNAAAVPHLLQPVSDIFGGTAGAALFDFASGLGAPQSLRELGLRENDLDRAAGLAASNAYDNPRAFDRVSILAMLEAAWSGERPPTTD